MFPTKGNRPASARSGFTLVELMVGTSVSLFITAGILSAYTFTGRHLTRMGNQQQLEATSRQTFSFLRQDVDMATKVTGISNTAPQLTLTLPPPNLTTVKTVAYSYDAAGFTLTRTVTLVDSSSSTTTITSTIVLRNATALGFNYFNSAGTATSTPLSVKRIELTFTSQWGSTISGTNANYSAVSPRLVLRNKPILGSPNS